jgi:hypothetical protein
MIQALRLNEPSGFRFRCMNQAHDRLDGKLRAAWLSDPDGNPVHVVQGKR